MSKITLLILFCVPLIGLGQEVERVLPACQGMGSGLLILLIILIFFGILLFIPPFLFLGLYLILKHIIEIRLQMSRYYPIFITIGIILGSSYFISDMKDTLGIMLMWIVITSFYFFLFIGIKRLYKLF